MARAGGEAPDLLLLVVVVVVVVVFPPCKHQGLEADTAPGAAQAGASPCRGALGAGSGPGGDRSAGKQGCSQAAGVQLGAVPGAGKGAEEGQGDARREAATGSTRGSDTRVAHGGLAGVLRSWPGWQAAPLRAADARSLAPSPREAPIPARRPPKQPPLPKAGPDPHPPALRPGAEPGETTTGMLLSSSETSARKHGYSQMLFLLLTFFHDSFHTFCEICTSVIANFSLFPPPAHFSLAIAAGKPETMGKGL